MLAHHRLLPLATSLLLPACFHTSTLSTARLVPVGQARAVLGASVATGKQFPSGPYVTPEAEVRWGLEPHVDAAVRASAAGEGAVDFRVGLVQQRLFALTAGAGFGVVYPWRAATRDKAPDLTVHLRLPVQLSVHPRPWLALYGDVTAHDLDGFVLSTTGGVQLGERFGLDLEVSRYRTDSQNSWLLPAAGVFAHW